MLAIWLLAALMVIHGLVHLAGISHSLIKVDGLPQRTIVPLTRTGKKIASVGWGLSCLLLLAAASGVILEVEWWDTEAWTGIALSQLMIILAWPDAKWGTLMNLLIAFGLWRLG